MISELQKKSVESVINSKMAFCKFLSANDTGATGGHQSGILVSVSAKKMMFNEELPTDGILKREVKIRWQDECETESIFTYYSSKRELRITKFGRNFSFLTPEDTGALFVFVKNEDKFFSAYILDTEDDIDEFLDAFGISSTETNCLFDSSWLQKNKQEELAIRKYILSLDIDFPETQTISEVAQVIANNVYNHEDFLTKNPDMKIIEWTKVEYSLFRALEQDRYGNIVKNGFQSMDEFVKVANSVLNRRKSRAGKSLEHHLETIFNANGVLYSSQAFTEGKKKPDFVFPSEKKYHDFEFPIDKINSLAAKTTCKDRWRQVLNEANRLKHKEKFLCTLQQGISPTQMDEMQDEQVILVVPKPYISCYPKDKQGRIWTISKFVKYIKKIQEM